MIRILFIVITLFAIIMVTHKRINEEKVQNGKKLIHSINKQYIELFKGQSSYLNLYQWLIFVLSQGLVVVAIISGTFKGMYKYIYEDYIVAVKILTLIVLLVAIYFIVGYFLLSITKVYKCLYKIEDKNTKTDLLISYFIISMYMTILIIFPEQFGENYKIGLIGVGISYILNLKVLLKIIRSPHIVEFKKDAKNDLPYNNIGVVSVILLIMVLLSLSLAVCFISSSSVEAYSNNPTYFDLFYYTVITFATIGYGDISPISPGAKMISMIIALTSTLCLTIFVSSVLSYKNQD